MSRDYSDFKDVETPEENDYGEDEESLVPLEEVKDKLYGEKEGEGN